ncbi:hypothetical protein [Salinibacterium sp. ZJ450]|uniref:hypothetical protein n=1 Tax=Salinibacterium sp. ZJ450 TaxID=2708338 RepID=UPI0014209746|nr:hypothetical protein [Salinibacterium sp. ZJ450]
MDTKTPPTRAVRRARRALAADPSIGPRLVECGDGWLPLALAAEQELRAKVASYDQGWYVKEKYAQARFGMNPAAVHPEDRRAVAAIQKPYEKLATHTCEACGRGRLWGAKLRNGSWMQVLCMPCSWQQRDGRKLEAASKLIANIPSWAAGTYQITTASGLQITVESYSNQNMARAAGSREWRRFRSWRGATVGEPLRFLYAYGNPTETTPVTEIKLVRCACARCKGYKYWPFSSQCLPCRIDPHRTSRSRYEGRPSDGRHQEVGNEIAYCAERVTNWRLARRRITE